MPSKSAEPQVDFDPSTIRVNFSQEEAGSEARDFSPVPSGKYLCAITEIDLRFSTSEKHNGKPYWAVTLNVQEGPYADRKFWANVMLFEGALYSLAQLCKATGHLDALESGQIPPADDFLGEKVLAVIAKVKDKYAMERSENPEEIIWKNDVKGFKALADAGSGSGGGSGSLLP